MNLKFVVMVFVTTEEHVISCNCLVELCLPVTVRFILLELFVRKVSSEFFVVFS